MKHVTDFMYSIISYKKKKVYHNWSFMSFHQIHSKRFTKHLQLAKMWSLRPLPWLHVDATNLQLIFKSKRLCTWVSTCSKLENTWTLETNGYIFGVSNGSLLYPFSHSLSQRRKTKNRETKKKLTVVDWYNISVAEQYDSLTFILLTKTVTHVCVKHKITYINVYYNVNNN